MTVEELIEKLKTYPPESIVYVNDDGTEYPINAIDSPREYENGVVVSAI